MGRERLANYSLCNTSAPRPALPSSHRATPSTPSLQLLPRCRPIPASIHTFKILL